MLTQHNHHLAVDHSAPTTTTTTTDTQTNNLWFEAPAGVRFPGLCPCPKETKRAAHVYGADRSSRATPSKRCPCENAMTVPWPELTRLVDNLKWFSGGRDPRRHRAGSGRPLAGNDQGGIRRGGLIQRRSSSCPGGRPALGGLQCGPRYRDGPPSSCAIRISSESLIRSGERTKSHAFPSSPHSRACQAALPSLKSSRAITTPPASLDRLERRCAVRVEAREDNRNGPLFPVAGKRLEECRRCSWAKPEVFGGLWGRWSPSMVTCCRRARYQHGLA